MTRILHIHVHDFARTPEGGGGGGGDNRHHALVQYHESVGFDHLPNAPRRGLATNLPEHHEFVHRSAGVPVKGHHKALANLGYRPSGPSYPVGVRGFGLRRRDYVHGSHGALSTVRRSGLVHTAVHYPDGPPTHLI